MRRLSPKSFNLLAAAAFSLALAACAPAGGPPPSVNVADVTSAAAANGPPLYCKVGRGSALFNHDWYDFNDVVFALPRGVPTNISLTRAHSTQQMTVQGLFDGGGQKLIFCPFLNVGAGQRIACNSLYALDDDLKDGIKRTFDIPAAVRGGFITCAYQQERLRVLTPGEGL